MGNKDRELYNRSMKSWLQDNYIEMQSTHNEQKSMVAERMIKTLRNKIYEKMISISENVYIDQLDDLVNEYNNTYHSTFKMEPINVKSSAHIDLVQKTMN